jgi:hypothetical protein
MKRSRPVACLVAAVLACAASGCSFKLVRPAPPREEWPDSVLRTTSQVPCTSSYTAPVADTLTGTLFGSLGYLERNSGSPKVAFVIGTAAVPMLISAVYGYISVTRCRAYRDRFYDAQAAGFPAAPSP